MKSPPSVETTLVLAASSGQVGVLEEAIVQGVPRKVGLNVCSLIMACACDENDIAAVSAWLPAFEPGHTVNADGSSHEDPLEMAARHGRREILMLLLPKYARGEGLDMPLYAASSNGQIEMIRLLLAAGADPSAVRSSALVVATRRDQVAAVSLLAPLCDAKEALSQCSSRDSEGFRALRAWVEADDLGRLTESAPPTHRAPRL